ncbi:hypothetical protein [Pediococcus pentosaceus]|uniref:hypothetical protein n=1 Tax=Pediococcus pentosaceus TaxID=1255 RepID=UPI0018A19225|nr:hypothetical protein [Pediococcus pentosaceus]MBF7129747.1 hypothetical protein [Pediococcus pentosaceus]
MDSAKVTMKNQNVVTISGLKEIRTTDILGENATTDFSDFALTNHGGDIRFIGDQVFTTNVNQIESILFE